jgi:L,D-peptidoglycan transpeptidase YkuD (ErfK/YbiS/YcfS/YnhG family)
VSTLALAVPGTSSVSAALGPATATTTQIVVVDAGAYGDTTARLSAYQYGGVGVGRWRRVFGPWEAEVGRSGFAPLGQKREGDGRTPSGTYGFGFFFGIDADDGFHFAYRRVLGPQIVWDDDSSSPLYNEWVNQALQSAGSDPEPMDAPPDYDYGAVIAYNTERTPHLGSAIFLHVSTGIPTSGCVALPINELLAVLHWLEPGEHPHIEMGVGVPAP